MDSNKSNGDQYLTAIAMILIIAGTVVLIMYLVQLVLRICKKDNEANQIEDRRARIRRQAIIRRRPRRTEVIDHTPEGSIRRNDYPPSYCDAVKDDKVFTIDIPPPPAYTEIETANNTSTNSITDLPTVHSVTAIA